MKCNTANNRIKELKHEIEILEEKHLKNKNVILNKIEALRILGHKKKQDLKLKDNAELEKKLLGIPRESLENPPTT